MLPFLCLCKTTLVIASLVLSGYAQDLAIPSSWRKPSITTPSEERHRLVEAAIQRYVQTLPPSANSQPANWPPTLSLFRQMAEFDLITNGNLYGNWLKERWPAAEIGRPHLAEISLSLSLWYGYAAISAYIAYKDQMFLDFAVEAWNYGRMFTLSDNDIESQGISTKPSIPSIRQSCHNASMAGGTFSRNDSSSNDLEIVATASFLILSASLAETTSNSTYLNTAEEIADFIFSQLYTNGYFYESISADGCKHAENYDMQSQGVGILALSIYSSLSRNETITALIQDIILNTTAAKPWYTADGVINQQSGGVYMIRGLQEVYERNAISSDLKHYIGSHIAVQFNSIIDQATANGTNMYSASWFGPPTTGFDADGQTGAIAVLLGALNVSSASETPIPTPNSDNSKPSRHNGSIIGGVLGGLAALLLLVLGIRYIQKRRNASIRHHHIHPLFHRQARVTTQWRAEKQSSRKARPTAPSSSHSESTCPNNLPRLVISAGGPSDPVPSRIRASHLSSALSPVSPDMLTTEELVSALNERLQPENWNSREVPPSYPQSRC